MALVLMLADTATVWDHFLMKGVTVTAKPLNGGGDTVLTRTAETYRWTIPDTCNTFDLEIYVPFIYKGKTYPLLRITQRFNAARSAANQPTLVPVHWIKARANQAAALPVISPQLHPLLKFSGLVVHLDIGFLDITEMFDAIHGPTPWFAALTLLSATKRVIKVLAHLKGEPLIWYAVIPQTVSGEAALQPNILYYPADFGGIYYQQDRMAGIAAESHNTSHDRIQCAGETLLTFLTQPLMDSDYTKKLPKYLAIQGRFKKRPGNKIPPLHHLRNVIPYDAVGGKMIPRHWDMPFGYERALAKCRQILIIPQLNYATGGAAIQSGLQGRITNLIMTIYAHGTVLTNRDAAVNKTILTCYSESGGNVFTAAFNNQADIKALVCFEPQYMNEHLKWKGRDGKEHQENKNLRLGKDVIPALLTRGAKVALVGRRTGNKLAKYIPKGVNPASLILLPDEAHYSITDYPSSVQAYNPAAYPVLQRRYMRLLHSTRDPVIDAILGSTTSYDAASANIEAKVEDIVASLKRRGLNDSAIVKAIFTGDLDLDKSGGYFTHNFIVGSGQTLLGDGETIKTFFEEALERIG
jgi:hypothetical protein